MDWTKETHARSLATAYVVGFVGWLIGVLWILYNQFTGGSAAAMIVGIVLFAIGQALISVVAFTLRTNFQTSTKASSFKLAWQHLAMGLELPTAGRFLLSR
jgi:glycerol-3-phosphate acyltransferase PlsY